MPFRSKKSVDTTVQSTPQPAVSFPEVEQLTQLIPERDDGGHFVWQPFVDRVVQRLNGLPALDGSESFVRACLVAGCEAVPVIHRNVMWKRRQPEAWDKRGREDFEFGIRLGLFFAASLRYLVHGICRLRIKAGNVEWNPWLGFLQVGEVQWHPILGSAVPFREYLAASDEELQITWPEITPHVGQVCLLTRRLLQPKEMELLPLDLLVDVLACAGPGAPDGLFGQMLFAAGEIEEEKVDVAAVFLEAVRQAVKAKRLRVNTNPGDLFVTPELSFLVAPAAVDLVIKSLGKKGPSFVRKEVYQALGAAGCLVGIGLKAEQHTPRVTVTSPAWRGPIPVRGLPIAHSALWDAQTPPPFLDGTVTIES